MTVVEKQMRAIRKVAVRLYDKNPEHFQIVITEIDLKLAELATLEFETLEIPDDFDLEEIA